MGAAGDLVNTVMFLNNLDSKILLITNENYKSIIDFFSKKKIQAIYFKKNYFINIPKLILLLIELILSKKILIMHKNRFPLSILNNIFHRKVFFSIKTNSHQINRYECLNLSFKKITSESFFKPKYQESNIKKKNYILVSTNGGNIYHSKSSRSVDINSLSEVINFFSNEKFIFVGKGIEDEQYYFNLSKLLKFNNYDNYVNKLDISELFQLAISSKICLLNDSFILNFAQYFKKEIIALFGPTKSEEVIFNNHISVIKSNSSCIECYNHIFGNYNLMYRCPGEECKYFDSKLIINEINKLSQ